MRKFCYLMLFCFAASLTGKEIALFPDQLKSWEKRGAKSAEVKFHDGELLLNPKADQDKVLLIRNNLPLQNNRQYTLTYEVKGEGKFGFYIEYRDASDQIRGFNAALHATPEKWKKTSFSFIFPNGAKSPYMVILAANSSSPVSFRGFSLKEKEESLSQFQWSNGENATVEGEIVLRVNAKTKVTSELNLPPGKSYSFSFQVIGETREGITGFPYFNASVLSDGKVIGGGEWDDTMTARYLTKNIPFTVPPSGKVEFMLQTRSRLLFKNFALQEVAGKEMSLAKVTLSSPYYRNTFYSSDPAEDIRSELTLEKGASSAKVTLSKYGKPMEIIRSAELKGGIFSFKDTASLPTGDYLLKVQPFDATGKAMLPCETMIRKLPKAPVEVTYRKNNMLYINGNPFVASGFWSGLRTNIEADAYAYGLSRAGVNTLVAISMTPQNLLKILDIAEKYRIKIIMDSRIDAFHKEKSDYVDDWIRYIHYMLTPEVLGHPALLGYALIDEPAWGGHALHRLRRTYDVIAALDPYRPIWINEAPRGTIAEIAKYGEACDIFGVDIYPIPYPNTHSGIEDKNITSVGAYAQRMRESVHYRKPVWMVLQGFSWKELHGKPDPVYPTSEENRFMAMDSMINGGCGIIYWGIQYIRQENFYLDLLKRCGEIRSLGRLWETGNTLKVDAAAGIQTFAAKIDGITYIVALNRTEKEVDAKIGIAGLYSLPEKQKVTSMKMAPYTAKVYATAPAYPAPLEKVIPYNAELEKGFNVFLQNFFAKSESYQGKASWIWYPGESKTLGAKAWLERRVQVSGKVKSAFLRLACDDEGDIFFNGKKIASAESWSLMRNVNLKPFLKDGENTLLIAARDMGAAPCGILADLVIVMENGNKVNMVSDAEWNARKSADGPSTKAEIVCPYGGGAWGSRVRVIPTNF